MRSRSGCADQGFQPGERLAVFLQNVPQFMLAMLAVWKAGGALVPINPMNKARELEYLLADSGATVLVALESLYADVAAEVVGSGRTKVRTVLTTNELDLLGDEAPPRISPVRASSGSREHSICWSSSISTTGRRSSPPSSDLTTSP